ncbi:MAG TPA: GTP cyclohydrolase II [Saprospiraceae bacterium]|nr:GTP cyclohydrolase II [Saprospiraceae bacterium]
MIQRQAQSELPTIFGPFLIIAYSDLLSDPNPHIVLVHKEMDILAPVPVRIHSECLTGDIFRSTRCDCGEQLKQAMKIIENKRGMLIYLRQEGRGIGLINKLKAYDLQDKGLNTIDANLHLGFQADERDYALAVHILKDLNVRSIDLITNNPDKIEAIENSSITLRSRIPIIIAPGPSNQDYLNVKRLQMGHLF